MPRAQQPYFTPGFLKTVPLVLDRKFDAWIARRYPPRLCRLPIRLCRTRNNSTGHRFPGGTISIDTLRSQALVGLVRAAKVAKMHLSADVANYFAAFTLSSLNRQPQRTADRLLLTATARTATAGSSGMTADP